MNHAYEPSTEASLSAYIEPRRQRVDEALRGYLRSHHERPRVLCEAMRYVVESGGKRIRPLLCIAAAEACGARMEHVLPTAGALELVHAFSLVHDDLPAMDDDAERRGRPSCHIAFGEAIAILTGDALFARAFELIALQARMSTPERALRVLEVISGALGTNGMVAGQAEDICAEGKPGDPELLEYIHSRKTAALIHASVLTGAILAGADEGRSSSLGVYGRAVGLAFQIVDDILGETGDRSELGKPVKRDRQRGKLSYPRLHGLDESRRMAEQKVAEALSAIAGFPASAEPLRGMAMYVLSRRR
jgi:geranylgeranyl diphosphate synthase, type II